MDSSTLGWIGGLLGGVLGIIGGIIGTYFSIKNTNGPMERSFVCKGAVFGWIAIVLFLVLMFLLPTPYKYLLWIPYGILLSIGIPYGNRKQQEIRTSEGRATLSKSQSVQHARTCVSSEKSTSKSYALLLVGIVGILVFGLQFSVQYGRAMWGNKDVWWTPMPLALSLPQATNDVKIFVNDQLLEDHIERGSLSGSDQTGKSYQVVSEDITIRLNNWNKIKASFFHSSVYSAFFLGVSLTCLILGVVQLFAGRKTNQENELA